MNILFATSEAHPLIKTGGLADVSGHLPRALLSNEVSIRVAIPAYRGLHSKLSSAKTIAQLNIDGKAINVLEAFLPGTRVKLWLIDIPVLFDRPGGPYQNEHGQDWHDNAERFGIFNKALTAIACGQTEISWPVDIVHCNDWQTGLLPVLLKLTPKAPRSLFTVHNLAYQGLFSYETFLALGLPGDLWRYDALEYYNQLSFMKAGLTFADRINTVSPQYAEEIKTPEFGCGLDSLLRHRSGVLSGILNGIDDKEWNPGQDTNLESKFNKQSLSKKLPNKLALQKLFGLPQREDVFFLVMVSRLTGQKGVDLIVKALPHLLEMPLQIALLGTGDRDIEAQLLEIAGNRPDKLSVKIAYNESWAHLLIAGGDAFLMPSRFEPCGLTQMYSMRYGTIPIVRNVGGLADTVTNIEETEGTGLIIHENTADELLNTIRKALTLYADRQTWKTIQLNCMRQDFSWKKSAAEYAKLYSAILDSPQTD